MSNLLASIGCAIMDDVDAIIEKRQDNVEIYNEILGLEWYASSPHCYPVRYPSVEERDQALARLDAAGIESRKAFSSLPTHEKVYAHMGYKDGDFPIAEHIGDRTLFVPVHQNIGRKEIEKVTAQL